MAKIDEILQKLVRLDGSDLHLTTGFAPYARIHGTLSPLKGEDVMDAALVRTLLSEMTPKRNMEEIKQLGDTDFSYEIAGVARFRTNLFIDRHGLGAVFRVIPHQIPNMKDIGLPPAVRELCDLSKGLVLVTGPTGSGKSTTLAAMINYINQNRQEHIITIEDPIEFVYENQNCLIHQREVQNHTKSFKKALRAALREDPDVVLIGEMRDLETVEIAIETAETGHLVFGTLHTTTAASTVDRIIDQFPGDQQAQIRTMLSSSLRGVISQTLCKRLGGGRVAAREILISNAAVAGQIREGKTHQITNVMQSGGADGMMTLNNALVELVRSKMVEPVEAFMKAIDRKEFMERLESAGLREAAHQIKNRHTIAERS